MDETVSAIGKANEAKFQHLTATAKTEYTKVQLHCTRIKNRTWITSHIRSARTLISEQEKLLEKQQQKLAVLQSQYKEMDDKKRELEITLEQLKCKEQELQEELGKIPESKKLTLAMWLEAERVAPTKK